MDPSLDPFLTIAIANCNYELSISICPKMLLCRRYLPISRTGLCPSRWCYTNSPASRWSSAAYHQLLWYSNSERHDPLTSKYVWRSVDDTMYNFRREARCQIHQFATLTIEDQSDPFFLVADELSLVAERLRSKVVAEVPKLASAAEYFFKMGVEGKRFRPTVLLLMATALNMPVSMSSAVSPSTSTAGDDLETHLRRRQQCIVEITEMIHVGSLLHDDILDDGVTSRDAGSLNSVMGNKFSVLAGDFMLSRACVAIGSLKNTEIASLLATVLEHLVIGETMQMTMTSEQSLNMQYYMDKTYYKTTSLISNGCKAVALLAGQTTEVAMSAHDYGKNLGLAYQLIDDILHFTDTSTSLGKGLLTDICQVIITAPLLFAIEEFPQLREVVQRGFDDPADTNLALDYLGRSQGIQRTKELALKHANLAAEAIDSLPDSDDEEVIRSRRALVDLTEKVIKRIGLSGCGE